MTEDMQVRNLALNTQTSYLRQLSLFARHFEKSPEQLGPEQIRDYQAYLTNEKKLAPSSVLIAFAALRFLYKVSLRRNWIFGDVIRKRQSNRIFLRECSSDEVGAWSRSIEQESIGGTEIGRKPISWQPSMKRAD
jgi:site-specific recombinase XerD